ncbi:hypothetical protein CRG98_037259 [Punica granatum]|uniref:Uncharacterized protein n=1 Tax=Punica granatum TaxID=22663 RepID=A0A2I0IF82_PUNGR|nr:hypothetical protein CRG98_037259 [Punica granatum]
MTIALAKLGVSLPLDLGNSPTLDFRVVNRKFILLVSFIFHLNIQSRNSMCMLWRRKRHSHPLKRLGHTIEQCKELLWNPRNWACSSVSPLGS